jgi:hypothetical protein
MDLFSVGSGYSGRDGKARMRRVIDVFSFQNEVVELIGQDFLFSP